MLQKFRKFDKLSRSEQLLFSEACFLQLTTGLLLKFIPFKWIPKLFSCRERETPEVERETLIQLKTAILLSGRYSPWKNKCLVSSLAARRMLNRRRIPSQLSLGVAKGVNGKMIAHAWLKADDFEIVEKGGDFSELHMF